VAAVIIAPWSTRFHGPGLEEGPEATWDALGRPPARRVEIDLEAEHHAALSEGLPRLAAAVAESVEPGQPPVALLGECTLTAGVAAPLRAANPGLSLVWIDAHGDLNTPETTPSGFLGGMPFAVLVGWCHDDLRAAGGLDPPLEESHAALVGARDLDPGERQSLDGSEIHEAAGVADALAVLPDGPLWLHLDGDVLDPSVAPNTDFPAPGGWSAERLGRELDALASSGRLVGISVCCGNPRRDPEGRGARALAGALAPLVPGAS
jgi:arginase